MATTDVTNSLIANISSTEQSTSNVDINRSVGNPAFNCNCGSFSTYVALAAGANALALPFSPCTQVYIKNIDPAKALIVTSTFNGGSPVNSVTLNPGDLFIFWGNPVGAPFGPGFTAITLTPNSPGCLVEYFLGG